MNLKGTFPRRLRIGNQTFLIDEFAEAYIDCALWSSTDDDDEPMDGAYGIDDIHPDSLASMLDDCRCFLDDNAPDIWPRLARAGHDFWLTRNRHGAGFWDGDWPDAIGARLTAAAHTWGSSDLYIGDDGLVHVSPI